MHCSKVYLVLFLMKTLVAVRYTEFPFLEFFLSAVSKDLLTTVDGLQEEKLRNIYSCNNGSPCCNCDAKCMETRSCCIDKLWNSSNPISLEKYVQKFGKEARKYKVQNCLPAVPFSSVFPFEVYEHYLMVDDCIPGASLNDIELCSNDSHLPAEQRIPVFGDDRYIYKNSRCAKCNFVETFHTASLDVGCFNRETNATNPAADILKEFHKCDIGINRSSIFEDAYFRKCYPANQRIKTCNHNRQSDLCGAYSGEMVDFKNIHCFACNNGNFSELTKMFRCSKTLGARLFPWSLTINFGGSTQITVSSKVTDREETVSICPEGQIFNLLDGKCKQFTCGSGFETNGISCVKRHRADLNIFTENSGFTRCLAIKDIFLYIKLKENTINITNVEILFEHDFNSTNETFSLVFQAQNHSIYKRRKGIRQNMIQNFTNYLKKGNLKTWDVVEEYTLSTVSEQLVTQMYGFEIFRTFNSQRLCAATNHITMISEGNFTNNCSFKTNDTFLPYSQVNMWKSYKQNEVNETLTYCSKFHLYSSCKMETFTGRYITFSNRTIKLTTFKNKTLFYSADEYLPVKNGISICQHNRLVKKNRDDYYWQQTLNYIQHYISVVGTSISIACHIFFILTYILLKELKNRGNLNFLTIVCALMFSDILYFIPAVLSLHDNLCKGVAIIFHWSLLLVVMWTIIISGDLVWYLKRKHTTVNQNYKPMFWRNILISITPSTLIIAASVSLNETGEVDFGYGNNGVCWIGYFYPLVVAYMIPAVVGYLCSFISLCSVLCFLHKHNRSSKRVLKHSSNVHPIAISKLALKLVIVLGLSEVLGFVQIYGRNLSENEMKFNNGFSLAYNIARSLRGAFICLIYLANKKTIKLYKRRFCSKPTNADIEKCSKKTNCSKPSMNNPRTE